MHQIRTVLNRSVAYFEPAFPPPLAVRDPAWAVPIIVSVGFISGILRLGIHDAFDTIWAEDGSIFLAGAYQSSPLAILLTPYAGYAHVVPRLIAPLAAVFPPAAAAGILTVSAIAVVTGVAVLAYKATKATITNSTFRFFFAMFIVMQPVADEVLGSLANLQWYLLFGAFTVLLWTSLTGSATVIGLLVCFLSATSSPFGITLIPIAILRILVLRHRRAWLAPIALVLGVAIQISVMLIAPTRPIAPETSPIRLAAWYISHVAAPTFFGNAITPIETGLASFSLGLLAIAFLGLLLWFCPASARARVWPIVIVTAIYSIVFYLVASATAGLAAPRYALPAALVLALAFAIVLSNQLPAPGSPQPRVGRERWRRPLTYGIAGIMAVGWVLALPAVRSGGNSWVDSIHSASQQCTTNIGGEVQVGISPPGWFAAVPCSRLLG